MHVILVLIASASTEVQASHAQTRQSVRRSQIQNMDVDEGSDKKFRSLAILDTLVSSINRCSYAYAISTEILELARFINI